MILKRVVNSFILVLLKRGASLFSRMFLTTWELDYYQKSYSVP